MLNLREQRLLCSQSFFHFVKIVGGSVNQGGIISPDIHKPLCKFFQDPNEKRIGILMPRDWRKSTIFTKWGAIWLYLRNHEERMAIVAETEKIASNMLDGIEKLILGCAKLRELYPELLVVDKSWTKNNKWSGTECMLPRKGFYSEPTITCLGVGAAAQSRHFTTAIFDDLCGKQAMESAVILEDTLRWFDNYHELLVEPQVDKPDASRAYYIGTHWILGDLPSYIMTEYRDEFRWRVVPAQKASEDRVKEATKEKPHVVYIQNDKQEVGETNWPEQFSTEYYTEMASNPQKQMIFWTQHMNMPTAAEGINTIKYEWIKFYMFEEDADGVVWVRCKDDNQKFRVCDMTIRGVIDPGGFASGSGIKKSSRNAFVLVGQARNTYKKFVLETWAQKIASPSGMMKKIFAAQRKWRVASWHVEVYASQNYILKDIREEVAKENIRLVALPLPPEHTDDAKNKRIQGLIQPISNGEVYMHETQKDAIAELINHPGGLTHDLADCMGWHEKMFWHGIPFGKTGTMNKKNMDAYIQARTAGR
jgi:hypothetical protein